MHIARVSIRNFRGIRETVVRFSGTSILLGDNNSGKSTIFEALELALGPERLYRNPPIDEHDFYGGEYLDASQELVVIKVEVVLVNLDAELLSRFRNNLEYWDPQAFEILDAAPQDSPTMCLRVIFRGMYDADEDDFVGSTVFAVPVVGDTSAEPFRTVDKREIGFLHLRALRTGNRAMSMERGSLLDVVLRSFEIELKLWETLLDQLRAIPVAGHEDADFGAVIQSLDRAMKGIVAAEWAEAPHLRVSDLTRDDLRRVLKAFMATGGAGHAAPFNRQGSGTVNSLVIAMLSLIAEKRNQRVIFAMEEPEISVPPTTQKRVVDLVRGLAGQALFTSHSPYVIEEFDSDAMLVVSRQHSTGLLKARGVELGSLKPKAFREGLRTRFAEALLARRVIVFEGKAESVAYPAFAKMAARTDPSTFSRLDTAGWAIFDAQGDRNVAGFAEFFRGHGKQVVTIFDKQSQEVRDEIAAHSDLVVEQQYKGFEDMLISEVPPTALKRFAEQLIAAGEWPQHVKPPADDTESSFVAAVRDLLTSAKGDLTAAELLSTLAPEEYPATIAAAIQGINALTASAETAEAGAEGSPNAGD